MTDPVEHLKEAHRRAEPLAQAATSSPWAAEEHAEHGFRVSTADGGSWVAWTGEFDDEPEPSRPDSLHIAANSLGKVLARITAERAVLTEHEPTWPNEPEYDHHHETVIGEHARTRYVEVRDDEPVPAYWCACCSAETPCRTVRLLAAGWGWGWTEET